MYYEVVPQCTQSLKLVEGGLDKAEAFAKTKNVDVGSLLNGSLAPDMKLLIYQVQSACDYVKAGAAWLSGQRPPRHEDNEKTAEELRARIRKTIEFAQSVAQEQYQGNEGRQVGLSWAPGKVLRGKDYLLQMTIPNVYFHIAMVYAILRNHAVDVGKMDFLGTSISSTMRVPAPRPQTTRVARHSMTPHSRESQLKPSGMGRARVSARFLGEMSHTLGQARRG
ncbi:DUF1993 domain-containing protein [Rhizobium sophorae]|uniref:DUF1993 domain-containing protein n=2 Tax=Rhizobium sophorae TaxID=1535242 RepID=A0A7Y3WD97_9HYPH|nr:DUF1993 domain-containing protein [Rhizobium sophorae]